MPKLFAVEEGIVAAAKETVTSASIHTHTFLYEM